MHEMAYVRQVVEIVTDHATRAGAKKVLAVHLTIGEQRDIIEDYFGGLFRHLARGGIAADAEIIINRVPLTVACNRCHTVYPLSFRDKSTWPCAHCGAEHDYKVFTGMEFSIDEIDVE